MLFVRNKTSLIAGPYVGEFGHELFSYQARLRWLVNYYNFENVVIIANKSKQLLYKDFATQFIDFDQSIPDNAVMNYCKGFNYIDSIQYDKSSTLRILPNTKIVTYNKYFPCQFNSFKNQKFRSYGHYSPDLCFDILIHARNTKKNNQFYKNWPLNKWEYLVNYFRNKGYTVASIGTNGSALHITGTENLLDIDLNLLTNVFRSSKILIGPSSGPIHLAALCKLPHLSWIGITSLFRYFPIFMSPNRALQRFNKDWNPFNTPVFPIYSKNWDISTEDVIYYFNCFTKKLHSFQ